jgi:pSer/pThr/pTyr-binding forkhead associated (FHA) protein
MKEYFAIRQFVSREHAKIEIIGSKIAIVDLGKPNGIFINNIKVESNSKNILRNGDKVSLGGGWPQNFEHDNTGCFIVNYP